MRVARYVHITSGSASVCGEPLKTTSSGLQLLSELYRSHVGDYPKFFKMDVLCKLGFIAAELLAEGEKDRFVPREVRAVLLFSKTGPLCNDLNYSATIVDDEYFPSPSLFVYTLANIVTGEISIRNKYKGDTTAFELPGFDPQAIVDNVEAAFLDEGTDSAICGWTECPSQDEFEAVMMLVERSADDHGLPFNVETLKKIRQ